MCVFLHFSVSQCPVFPGKRRGCCCSSDDKVVAAGFPTLKASAGSCVPLQPYMMWGHVNVQTRYPWVNALPRKHNLHPRLACCKAAIDAGTQNKSSWSDWRFRSPCPPLLPQICPKILSPHWSLSVCEHANGSYKIISFSGFAHAETIEQPR